MTMYHISKNGQPGECRAHTRICPLGNGEHFQSSEAAYEALLNGTAKLPSYPKTTAEGHTMMSVIYNADDNKFRALSKDEVPLLPRGHFVLQAKIDGKRTNLIFRGSLADTEAPLVGRQVRIGPGKNEFYLNGRLEGGQPEDVQWLSELFYKLEGQKV